MGWGSRLHRLAPQLCWLLKAEGRRVGGPHCGHHRPVNSRAEVTSQAPGQPLAVGGPRAPEGSGLLGGQSPFPGGCPSLNEPSGTQGDPGAGSSLQRHRQDAGPSRAWLLPSRAAGFPSLNGGTPSETAFMDPWGDGAFRALAVSWGMSPKLARQNPEFRPCPLPSSSGAGTPSRQPSARPQLRGSLGYPGQLLARPTCHTLAHGSGRHQLRPSCRFHTG